MEPPVGVFFHGLHQYVNSLARCHFAFSQCNETNVGSCDSFSNTSVFPESLFSLRLSDSQHRLYSEELDGYERRKRLIYDFHKFNISQLKIEIFRMEICKDVFATNL